MKSNPVDEISKALKLKQKFFHYDYTTKKKIDKWVPPLVPLQDNIEIYELRGDLFWLKEDQKKGLDEYRKAFVEYDKFGNDQFIDFKSYNDMKSKLEGKYEEKMMWEEMIWLYEKFIHNLATNDHTNQMDTKRALGKIQMQKKNVKQA